MAKNKNRQKLVEYSKKNGIPLWRVAEKVGLSEFTFSRHLRHLTEEKCKEYKQFIDEIKVGEKHD